MGFDLGSALGVGAAVPFLGPLLGVAGDVAGTLIQGDQNRKISSAQMEFQERMSGSAHQREVEDLKKAGLNPMLSVNEGASSGPGAGIPYPSFGKIGEGVVSSALEITRVKKELEEADSRIKLNENLAGKAKTDKEKGSAEAEIGKLKARVINYLKDYIGHPSTWQERLEKKNQEVIYPNLLRRKSER